LLIVANLWFTSKYIWVLSHTFDTRYLSLHHRLADGELEASADPAQDAGQPEQEEAGADEVVVPVVHVSHGQQDKIGRIFAQWAIVYFGQFFLLQK
jgi:hypothetical protein